MLSAGYAQVMPGSDASGIIKNVNVPVNLYTGVASVSVPLYELETNNGGNVPISLQYNTTGIKVEEIAGVAGLGWNLLAGGTISRVLRDRPDSHWSFGAPDENSIKETFVLGRSRNHDFEKDLFYFSYPGGSGKFVSFGSSGSSYKTLPESDLKIEFKTVNGIGVTWVITDLGGTKYYFAEHKENYPQNTSEYMRVSSTINNGNYYNEKGHVASWHLLKIEYPNGEFVSFEYVSGGEVIYYNKTYEKRLKKVGNTYTLDGTPVERTVRRRVYPRLLSKITTRKAEVVFSYKGRSDLTNGMALNRMLVKDRITNNTVTTIKFNHSYFNASDSYYKGGTYGTCNDEKCLRLALRSIDINNHRYRTFDYNNNKEFHSTQNYDLYELPPRDSYYYDHWGYFAGGNHHDTYQGEKLYVSHTYNASPYLKGMKRHAVQSSMANMLTKVTYPEGGYTRLAYGYNIKNGGVRIASIEQYDETNTRRSKKRYVYSGSQENNALVPSYIAELSVDNDGSTFADHVFSHAQSHIFDLNGPTSGYRMVEVRDDHLGGYEKHYFVNADDYGTSPSCKTMTYYKHPYGQPDNGNYGVETSYGAHCDYVYPFTTHTLQDYMRGLEKKVEVYDASNVKVQEVESIYGQTPTTSSVMNHNVHFYKQATEGGSGSTWSYYFIESEYEIRNRYVQLDKTIARTYDDAGALASTVETDYDYLTTGTRSLPKKVKTTQKDGNNQLLGMSEQHIYYPENLLSTSSINFGDLFANKTAVLTNMVNQKHMKGVPVYQETREHRPEYGGGVYKITGATLNTFKLQQSGNTGEVCVPHKSYISEFNTPKSTPVTSADMRLTGTTVYNGNGWMTSQTDADNVEIQYAYDSKGYMTSTTTYPGLASENATTTYEYYPLIGLKSVTSEDGSKVEYEYDSRNRLLLTKDENGDIMERYRYKYANESDGPGFNLTVNDQGGDLHMQADLTYSGYSPSSSIEESDYSWVVTGNEVTNIYYDPYDGAYYPDLYDTEPFTLNFTGSGMGSPGLSHTFSNPLLQEMFRWISLLKTPIIPPSMKQ